MRRNSTELKLLLYVLCRKLLQKKTLDAFSVVTEADALLTEVKCQFERKTRWSLSPRLNEIVEICCSSSSWIDMWTMQDLCKFYGDLTCSYGFTVFDFLICWCFCEFCFLILFIIVNFNSTSFLPANPVKGVPDPC